MVDGGWTSWHLKIQRHQVAAIGYVNFLLLLASPETADSGQIHWSYGRHYHLDWLQLVHLVIHFAACQMEIASLVSWIFGVRHHSPCPGIVGGLHSLPHQRG